MKNRNIQFKSTAGLLIPLLLACFAAVFVSAPAPASARDQVPFRASFSTEVEIEFVYPFFYISVTGHGNASHMGATTAVTDNQVVNVIDGTATATYTLTGANGDTVVLDMIFQTTFLPDNAVTFEGTYTVIGGTGRFYGATGSGDLAGSAIATGPNTAIGSFSVAGTIGR
jgi:hypothetical protein